jgi:hypothetical protein
LVSQQAYYFTLHVASKLHISYLEEFIVNSLLPYDPELMIRIHFTLVKNSSIRDTTTEALPTAQLGPSQRTEVTNAH